MPKRRTSRIYSRTRGGETRYYADFRDYADVGGGREALVAKGEKLATTDEVIATALAADRLRELEGARRRKAVLGVRREGDLETFAAEHLRKKARGVKKGLMTEQWLTVAEKHLATAIDFFGASQDVASITTEDVQKYILYLEELPSGRRDETIGPGTQRKYLNSLSNLYRRAQSEGLVPPGYNPVAALMEKPTADREEAHWLEITEATLLLEAARTYRPKREDIAQPAIYPLLATFLLTGGRETEVYGLDLEDVSFDRKIIHIRPNRWRRLKTKTSRRIVPLWPQLEEILREYVFGGGAPRTGLLFPSTRRSKKGKEEDARKGKETVRMITDIRKTLDALAARIGYQGREIRTKAFRHTYCATRLQTIERGYPVSPWTVAKEMGHGGRELVDRIYGHIGEIRHRSETVEYRVEQHMEAIGEMVADLRAGAL